MGLPVDSLLLDRYKDRAPGLLLDFMLYGIHHTLPVV